MCTSVYDLPLDSSTALKQGVLLANFVSIRLPMMMHSHLALRSTHHCHTQQFPIVFSSYFRSGSFGKSNIIPLKMHNHSFHWRETTTWCIKLMVILANGRKKSVEMKWFIIRMAADIMQYIVPDYFLWNQFIVSLTYSRIVSCSFAAGMEC